MKAGNGRIPDSWCDFGHGPVGFDEHFGGDGQTLDFDDIMKGASEAFFHQS